MDKVVSYKTGEWVAMVIAAVFIVLEVGMKNFDPEFRLIIISVISIYIFVTFYFREREAIIVKDGALLFNLRSYQGELIISEIVSIELKENVNNILVTTACSKHFHKLHSFKRSQLEFFIKNINLMIR